VGTAQAINVWLMSLIQLGDMRHLELVTHIDAPPERAFAASPVTSAGPGG
jgi:hypothetical protein